MAERKGKRNGKYLKIEKEMSHGEKENVRI
jgi:hypothetical protein